MMLGRSGENPVLESVRASLRIIALDPDESYPLEAVDDMLDCMEAGCEHATGEGSADAKVVLERLQRVVRA
jgi:hypothetical protein